MSRLSKVRPHTRTSNKDRYLTMDNPTSTVWPTRFLRGAKLLFCFALLEPIRNKANLNTIGIVPHNRDGEVGAETDDSFTCAFDSLTRGTTYIPFETAIVVTIPIDPTALTMDDQSHELDYGQSHKRSVADAVLKRGGTPILFALLGLTAKNRSINAY